MPKFRIPHINSLRAFEAAARHQSFKKGGDELHITRGGVSRHIQKLERQIGRGLFERRHRQVVLTEAGNIMFNAVTTGLSHIQRAFTLLSGSGASDRLVISVDPDFAALWLVPRLGDFYDSVPGTFVEIVSEETSASVVDPGISCAIQYARAGLKRSGSEMLFRSRLSPVCAKTLLQKRPLKTPDDLRRHVLLHDRSVAEWDEYLRSCTRTSGIDFRAGPVFSETALCLEAATHGQGVAMGDDFLAAGHLAAGRLVMPFKSSLLSKNAYYFIVADDGSKHPTVDAFRQWLFKTIDK